MGIFDILNGKRRQREAEEAERAKQQERDRQAAAERERSAALARDQERQREKAQQERALLPEARQASPGAAERLFADDATKARMRQAATVQPNVATPSPEPEKRIATERENRNHPVIAPPTLGPGTSRTAIRETLAAKLAREKTENKVAPTQAAEQSFSNHPKPEIVRMDERNLSAEQLKLRQIGDDLKAHKIDRVTALDKELSVLTRPGRTNVPDRSQGRRMVDEG